MLRRKLRTGLNNTSRENRGKDRKRGKVKSRGKNEKNRLPRKQAELSSRGRIR